MEGAAQVKSTTVVERRTLSTSPNERTNIAIYNIIKVNIRDDVLDR